MNGLRVALVPLLLAVLVACSSNALAAAPTPSSGAAARPTVERKAARALRSAQRAKQLANAALKRVSAAVAAAQQANDRLDSLAVQSATATGTVMTGSETDYVSLGGPSVTVDVPPSGLIEVWSTVTFDDPSDGLVALYEDGQAVPNDDGLGICGTPDLTDVLLSASLGPGNPVTVSTPASPLLFGVGCGTPGEAPSPVLFERSPGTHTYELRYADCGCDPADASFSNRTLRVAPRP